LKEIKPKQAEKNNSDDSDEWEDDWED